MGKTALLVASMQECQQIDKHHRYTLSRNTHQLFGDKERAIGIPLCQILLGSFPHMFRIVVFRYAMFFYMCQYLMQSFFCDMRCLPSQFIDPLKPFARLLVMIWPHAKNEKLKLSQLEGWMKEQNV